MKINVKSKNATKQNKPTAKAPLSAAQSKQTAKYNKTAKTPSKKAVKVVLPGTLKWQSAIAVLTGERGILARQVMSATDKASKRTFVKAVKNENGLNVKDSEACEIVGSVLTGDKIGRVQMGGYVNGKSTGAHCELTTLAAFKAKSAPCVVKWKADDDNGIHGRYIGNPNQKGICAVLVSYNGGDFVWQMELDSNSNNKHERGTLLPVKPDGKLVSVSW